jgi:hypothetical protein
MPQEPSQPAPAWGQQPSQPPPYGAGLQPNNGSGANPPGPPAWGYSGSNPSDGPKSPRPLWKKKRVIIPSALIVLAIAGNAGGNGNSPDAVTAATSSSADRPPVDKAADEAKEAEEAAAKEKAAADKAAAEQAAKDKAAADKAAAEAAAAAAKAAEDAKPFNAISARDFALLVKNPDAHAGQRFVIYGEVTQFDAATGNDQFLARTGAEKDSISYGYTDFEDNSLVVGDSGMLADVVEGDVFEARVVVSGSMSYETQIGGNTTVPEFELRSISVYGSTK